MKIKIRYPKIKFIEAKNADELKKKLTRLMIIDFEIKKRESDKSYIIISKTIKTIDVNKDVLQLIEENDGVIFPLNIQECEV